MHSIQSSWVMEDVAPAITRSSGQSCVRVLTLTPFYPSANDEVRGCFIAEPLPYLEVQGIRNQVIGVQPFYREPVIATQSVHNCTWIPFFSLPGGLGSASAGLFLRLKILSLVRRWKASGGIDLIHAHGALPCGHTALLLSRELGIPFVVSVHGRDAYSTRQHRGPLGHWCARVSQTVYEAAQRVICISQVVEEEVQNRSRQTVKTTVVYNGADSDVFAPSKESDSDTLRILAVGNLIAIKGQDDLLRAVAQIEDTFPSVTCDFIGDGPDKGKLLGLARRLGIEDRVTFHGPESREQVAEALRRCTVFALPSHYEGLGCVYLEAMASGKPTIACEGQGIAEVIQSGHNGLLVPPNDVDALARSLATLLADKKLRERMGAAARATIARNFTWIHHAQRMAALYRECVQ